MFRFIKKLFKSNWTDWKLSKENVIRHVTKPDGYGEPIAKEYGETIPACCDKYYCVHKKTGAIKKKLVIKEYL